VTSGGLAAGSIVLTTVPQPGGPTNVLDRAVSGAGAVSFALKSGLHSVKMDYWLEKKSRVRITVLLLSGRVVGNFDEGTMVSGPHSWSWKEIAEGNAYFFRLQAGGRSITRMLVVL
jgi:hypothetical protein